MKKNLRIVSVAAAALLAVAPVAASTVSTVNAATIINAGSAINTNTNAKYDVDVTPNVSAIAKVAGGSLTIPGNLTGSISASYNGKSYTANLPKDSKNATITDDKGVTVKPADLEAGKPYTVTVPDVSFNFGSENADKEITIGSANQNVTFTKDGKTASTVKVKLDQNGVATLSSVQIKNVYAVNTTDNRDVNFYDVTTGATVKTGAVSLDADNQGQLNTASVVAAITSKYFAAQYAKKQLSQDNVVVNTETAVKDALKAQKIEVNSVGYFKAPHTFTVNVKATSNVNSKSATLPVTVTVPNIAEPVAPSVSKTIMHNAYYYNKEGQRVGTEKATRYDSVTVAPKTTTINGKTYYQVVENGKAVDKYINAGNIDGTKRTLKHNAYVYKTSKKRANKVVLKKGDTVTTYGASYKFKNGKRYYKIGNNTDKTYVKVANFQ